VRQVLLCHFLHACVGEGGGGVVSIHVPYSRSARSRGTGWPGPCIAVTASGGAIFELGHKARIQICPASRTRCAPCLAIDETLVCMSVPTTPGIATRCRLAVCIDCRVAAALAPPAAALGINTHLRCMRCLHHVLHERVDVRFDQPHVVFLGQYWLGRQCPQHEA
jgi:hypothetical protein